MTKFNDALLQSMLDMLNARNLDAVQVVAYEEVEKSDGYCDSCYYEWTEVEITYLTNEGQTRVYSYGGDFGELIRELTND